MPGTTTNEKLLQPNPHAGGRPEPPIIFPVPQSGAGTGGNSPNGGQGSGQNSMIIDDDVLLTGPSTGLTGTPQTNQPFPGGAAQPTNPSTDFINTVPGMVPGTNGAGGPVQGPASGNATGWRKSGNNWYYIDPDGTMAKGWRLVEGKWYYLDKTTGIMATGWILDGELWYYLKPGDGYMLIDWQYIDGEWYYLETTDGNGQMVTGWKLHEGKWYYLFASGAMAHGGWPLIDGKWYCVKDNGEMEASKILVYNGKNYYVGDDGAMVTSENKQTVTYNGVTYEVAEDGVCTAINQDKIDKFVEVALNEKGKVEIGTNGTPYNNWFYNKNVSGSSYSWCSVFVLWAGNAAGILDGNIMPTLQEAHKGYFEGVSNLKGWYVAKGRVQKSDYYPKKGDIIFYTWSHTGIVVAYDKTTNLIYTIEGNSGDAVRLQIRSVSEVDSFGVNGGSSYGTIPQPEELNPSSSNKYR